MWEWLQFSNNYVYESRIPSIKLTLTRMKHNDRINTSLYYDEKDNDVVSYSNIPLTEDCVVKFFLKK